ncbi:MAG: fimbrillin family protein [Bacteroidales bacterium]|nr:fimbrillin family protein [Bacteroidales bacterium]
MNKIFNSALLLLCGLALLSCRQEASQLEGSARVPIQFRATAGAFQVKATDTAFEPGDAIGLSVSKPVGVSNALLQSTDEGLIPQETIYWPFDQSVVCGFDAYYPYQEGADFVSGFSFTVNSDQSSHALYTASDFMCAHTESAKKDGVVDLKFTHQLSKLVLVIDNKLDEDIADVYVGGVQGRAKVVAGSAPVAEGLPGTIKAGTVKLSGIGPAYALVMVPQKASPKLMVTTVSGKQYDFVLPQAVSFAPGMRYLTNITLSANCTFSDLSIEVSEWTDNADIEFKSAFAEVIDGTDGQKYTVTGTITQVLNTNYGNMLLESEGQTIYIYGLLTPNGKYPYQAGGLGGDAFNVAVGDQITVYGIRTIMNEMVTLRESTLLGAVRSEAVSLGSIREVLEADCGPRYAFSGIVHAVSSRGFVLYDGGAAVLVYTGSAPSCSVGDEVDIVGATIIYRGCREVNMPQYSVVSSDNELYDMIFDDITESLDNVVVEESRTVSLVGTLDIQGNDYLLTVEGASSKGSIYWPARDLGIADLNGKKIWVEGFLLFNYNSDPRLYDIMATSVKEMKINVVTGDSSDVSSSSATVSGSYSDAHATVRECGFRWGLSAERLDQVAQADNTDSPFTVTLTNLGEDRTYYYQAYVILQNGEQISDEFLGLVESFTTSSSGSHGTSGAAPQWAELPVINFDTTDTYKIDTQNSNLYYAWHISPDIEGPEGRLARNYTVCFSAQHHCPVWVAAPRHSMYVGNSGRTEAYGPDPDIPADIQYNSKSTGGGCNKGHMLGSAERTCSKATNRQVFYYANIAPQLSSGFNTGGGGWNILEDYVDGQVCSDTLYVVIGCYFDEFTDGYGKTASPGTISFGGRDDVSIPTMFYYILLRTKNGSIGKSVKDCSASELKCAAFVRTHTNALKGQKVSANELMSVADLERITGFTYFPNVPNAPKTSFSASDWGL